MNSFLLPQFFVCYRALPEQVRQQARQAYSLFQQDPHHSEPPFPAGSSYPPDLLGSRGNAPSSGGDSGRP
jgi:hypothetical protein